MPDTLRSSFIKRVFYGITIVFAAYSMYLSQMSVIREPFWLLPLTYIVFFSLCKNNRNEIGKTPGNTALNIIMFLRYSLLPTVILSTGDYGGFVKDYSYMSRAIYLMMYELAMVFIANELFIKNIKPKQTRLNTVGFSFKKHNVTIWGAIITLLVLLALDPTFVGGFSLVTQGFVETDMITTERSSFMSILWQAMTTWMFVYLVFFQRYRYEETKLRIYFIFAILITLGFILLTFIAQHSISRWYTIINSIAAIFCLLQLFPQKRSSILLYVLSPFILLITVVTIYKNVSTDAALNATSVGNIVTSSGFLNSYLAGPTSVNNAIGLKETGLVGIRDLPNDILNNFPVLNHYVLREQTTVYQYNNYIGRIWSSGQGDQIIPLIGQGLAYFGPILCIILPIIVIYLIRFFDTKFVISTSPMMFVLAFLACWFGVEMCLNMTINLSWIYIRVIPMWLLFYVTGKLNI